MVTPKKPSLLKNKYLNTRHLELVIFVFLLFEFVALASEKTLPSASFVTTHYLITYEFGLISRGLIGSLFSLFTNRLTIQAIYISAIISFLLLVYFISVLLARAIRMSEPTTKDATIIFTILFLASPLSVTYLLGFHFARFDIYWIIITLVALTLLKRSTFRWLVPFFCATAILIHPGYMFTYMPGLVIPMLYEVYKNRYSKRYIGIFTLCCLTMILLFLYLQFHSNNIPYHNAVDYANYLSGNSGFSAYAPMIHLEYYAPFPEWFTEWIWPLTLSYALPYGITLLAFSFPLLMIFGYVWTRSFKSTNNKFLKFVFVMCILSPLAFVPAALFGNDWDRWWAAVINNQFILIFYFIFSNESVVIKHVKRVGDFFSKHFLLFLLIIILTNSLTFSRAATLLFSYIMDLKGAGKDYLDYINEKVYGLSNFG